MRRFETAPGVEAQVDWGHLGYLEDPSGEQALSGFTFTLGYSREMMAEAALDQKLGTLRLHEEAFRQLRGVPREILYDNMKTVALGRDERDEVQWHPQFLDFARYWGFTPRLCRPYRAQTKGKVESGVKYVRRNFLCASAVVSVTHLCQAPGMTSPLARDSSTPERSSSLPARESRGRGCRIRSRDIRVCGRLCVLPMVEPQAEEREHFTHRSANFGRVFANSRGEYESINSAQHRNHGANSRSQAVDIHCKR